MTPSHEALPFPRCLCASVRRAGRLLTRHYEEALRPAGMSVSQFELMMTIQAMGPVPQSDLAQKMETDQTTLSRNLRLLAEERWIEMEKDKGDGRRRRYRTSKLGSSVLMEATLCWRRAHEEMERMLGAPMSNVWPMLDQVMEAARGKMLDA